jgi:putative phosphoribosyl transferase
MSPPLWVETNRGTRLAVELRRPTGSERQPAVVLAHNWGSSRRSARNHALADALVVSGMAVVLFDFRGHGDSTGERAELTLDDQVDDLRGVLDWTAARSDLGPLGIAGASSGAGVALAAAAGDARVQALVLRTPSEHVQAASAARVRAPTLVLIGSRDPLRPRTLTSALRRELRVCSVGGAGDRFEEPSGFEIAVRETVDWFQRHLLRVQRRSSGTRSPRSHGAAAWHGDCFPPAP